MVALRASSQICFMTLLTQSAFLQQPDPSPPKKPCGRLQSVCLRGGLTAELMLRADWNLSPPYPSSPLQPSIPPAFQPSIPPALQPSSLPSLHPSSSPALSLPSSLRPYAPPTLFIKRQGVFTVVAPPLNPHSSARVYFDVTPGVKETVLG